jgi:hypothetical protein
VTTTAGERDNLPAEVSGAGDLRLDGLGIFAVHDPFALTGEVLLEGNATLELYAENSLAAPAAVETGGTSTLRFEADQRLRALTLGAGTTLATGGNDLTVEGRLDAAGTLVGSGGIRLDGDRAHSVTGTSRNYTGTVAVNAGSLALNGVLGDAAGASAGLRMSSGTTLAGTGTFLGTATLTRGSRHEPGNSIGTQTFSHYELHDGATLALEFGWNGSAFVHDQVVFTESATVGQPGGDRPTLALAGLPTDFFYNGHERFAVLAGEAGATLRIEDTPAVTGAPRVPLVSFVPRVRGKDLEVAATRTEYDAVPGAGLAAHEAATADVFDRIVETVPTGSRSSTATFLRGLDGLGQAVLDGGAGAAPAYQQAWGQLSGERLFAVGRSHLRATHAWSTQLADLLTGRGHGSAARLSAAADPRPETLLAEVDPQTGQPTLAPTTAPAPQATASSPWRARAEVLGARLADDTVDGISGYEADLYGVLALLDYPVLPAARLGATVAYSSHRADFDQYGGHADLETLRLGPTVHLFPEEPYSLTAAATVGHTRIDTRRPVSLNGSTASGETHGWDTTVQVDGTYPLAASPRWQLDALGGLRWIDFQREDFSESGAGIASLEDIEDRRSESLVSTLHRRPPQRIPGLHPRPPPPPDLRHRDRRLDPLHPPRLAARVPRRRQPPPRQFHPSRRGPLPLRPPARRPRPRRPPPRCRPPRPLLPPPLPPRRLPRLPRPRRHHPHRRPRRRLALLTRRGSGGGVGARESGSGSRGVFTGISVGGRGWLAKKKANHPTAKRSPPPWKGGEP